MSLDFKGLTSTSSRIVLAWSSSVGVKIFMRVARVAVFSVVSGLGCILRRDRKCQGRRQAALLRSSLSFHRGCRRESNDVVLFIFHDTVMEFFMRKNGMKMKRRQRVIKRRQIQLRLSRLQMTKFVQRRLPVYRNEPKIYVECLQ